MPFWNAICVRWFQKWRPRRYASCACVPTGFRTARRLAPRGESFTLTSTYPASTGRNFSELLRVIDSLQLTAKHAVATPADWIQGQPVIIVPAISDAEAAKRFPQGFVAKKPYLRVLELRATART